MIPHKNPSQAQSNSIVFLHKVLLVRNLNFAKETIPLTVFTFGNGRKMLGILKNAGNSFFGKLVTFFKGIKKGQKIEDHAFSF